MGRVANIIKSTFAKRGVAPGKSVVLKTKAAGSEERTVELWHSPGVSSAPTAGDKVAVLETPGGRIAIATRNYRVEVEPDSGETILFSTNSDGDTVKAKIKLDENGNIIADIDGDMIVDLGSGKTMQVEGNTESLVTYSALNTALQGLVTAINAALATKQDSAGTAGALTLDISGSESSYMKTGG